MPLCRCRYLRRPRHGLARMPPPYTCSVLALRRPLGTTEHWHQWTERCSGVGALRRSAGTLHLQATP